MKQYTCNRLAKQQHSSIESFFHQKDIFIHFFSKTCWVISFSAVYSRWSPHAAMATHKPLDCVYLLMRLSKSLFQTINAKIEICVNGSFTLQFPPIWIHLLPTCWTIVFTHRNTAICNFKTYPEAASYNHCRLICKNVSIFICEFSSKA